ncbi:hypothetical protein L6R46_29880 [Myxococcota bacterium]|nr:hypothetical protein [Myxococcota bacterium]
MQEDGDLDIRDQPAPGEGFDDAHLTQSDLDRPLGGYTISEEDERAEQLRVYREDGDRAVEAYLEQREEGADPPPRPRRGFFR